MSLSRVGLSPPRQQLLSRLLQASIAVILVVGLSARNLSIIINASLALVATLIPATLARDYRISLGPGVTLWISTALFLHTLGMFGLYDNVWWYDHVTHTLSATIVAAIGYVSTRAIAEQNDNLYLPPKFMFVYVLLFTLALGVFWEVLEFGARFGAEFLGLDPVLVQYGFDDSLLDLVFNTVGAVLVAIFGTQRVSDLVEAVTTGLDERRNSTDTSLAEVGLPSSMRSGLETLLESASTNTRLAWLVITFLFVAAPMSALDGRVLQTVFVATLLSLALVPAVVARDLHQMLPWQLLLIAALPIVGHLFSLPGVSSGVVTYFSVAAIALVVAVELHLFTPVQMTPGFAVSFVMITTMATAGIWAVARWVSDLYLGTQFLLVPGLSKATIENRLMWEFVYSTLTGIGAGILYELGFRSRSHDTEYGYKPDL